MKEFTFKAYLVSLALTEAVFAEKSGEEQGVLVAGYITEVSKKLEEAVENGASKEELETLRDEITKASSNSNVVMNTIKEHGVAIKELLNANAIAPSVSKTSIREQLEANKEAIASYAAGDERVKVSFKADMSIAGNAAGVPEPERISGVNDVATREITFVNVMTGGAISKANVEWVYKANKAGTAGATAEGALKNNIEFDLLVGTQKVEKVTAYIVATDEMLSDLDYMAGEIKNELTTELSLAIESAAYQGSGVSPILSGVKTVAPVFQAGVFAGTIESANEVDVLVVAALQIKLANHRPTHIFVNPITVARLKMQKLTSTDKRYVQRLLMVGSQLTLDGIPIIETTLVDEDDYIMGDMKKANIRTRQGMTVEIGLNADNFVKNFKTIRAEWRGVVYVKHNDRSAFVQSRFQTDIGDLAKP